MNIIKDFLLNSWQLAAVAWITSIVSGISRVGLLIITNLALEPGQDALAFSLMFIGLCLFKLQGKTVFVITHDDQYYHLADRCIRFESGQVIN